MKRKKEKRKRREKQEWNSCEMQTSVNGDLEDSEKEAAGNGEVNRVRGVKETSKQPIEF